MPNDYHEGDAIKFAVMQNDLTYIKEKLVQVDDKVSKNYVTNDQFEPVKRIVYGLVSLVLIAVVGAIVGLVVK